MKVTNVHPQLPLTTYVAEYGHSKYDWYFPFYDRVLNGGAWIKRFLEIGCSSRSLKTWQACFPYAEIVGLDLSPRGPTNTDDLPGLGQITFVQGDQVDKLTLVELGAFDVVVDDGGHFSHQQITSWEILFPRMRSGGWYFIEDLHCSYDEQYQGDESWTTVEVLKMMIDDLHGRYMKPRREQRWPIAEIRFVDSLVAIRRA